MRERGFALGMQRLLQGVSLAGAGDQDPNLSGGGDSGIAEGKAAGRRLGGIVNGQIGGGTINYFPAGIREQGGNMAIFPQAELDQIQGGQAGFTGRDNFCEFRNRLADGDFRIKLTAEAVNICGGKVEGFEEGFLGNFEIAVGAFGRDAAFIGPKEVDVVEGNGSGAGQFDGEGEKGLDEATAGEGDAVILSGCKGFGNIVHPGGGGGAGQSSGGIKGKQVVVGHDLSSRG